MRLSGKLQQNDFVLIQPDLCIHTHCIDSWKNVTFTLFLELITCFAGCSPLLDSYFDDGFIPVSQCLAAGGPADRWSNFFWHVFSDA